MVHLPLQLLYKTLQQFLSSSMSNDDFNFDNQNILLRIVWPLNGILLIYKVLYNSKLRQD
jgi:hypothetical protein